MNWQPIETAPKDRPIILGQIGSNPRVTEGYWYTEEHGPQIGDCGGECRCHEYDDPCEPFWNSFDGGFTVESPPTHWMELPTLNAGSAQQ